MPRTEDASVRLASGAVLRLRLADLNRLRWAIQALRMRGAFAEAASALAKRGDRAFAIDGNELIRSKGTAPEGAMLILWDGLNSFEELVRNVPSIVSRPDLSVFVVGNLEDARDGFRSMNIAPLFPGKPDWAQVDVPKNVSFRIEGTTRIRAMRNSWRDRARHRQLARGGLVAFCGTVRPSEHFLDDVLRGIEVDGLREPFQRLVGISLGERSPILRDLVDTAYRAVRRQSGGPPGVASTCYALGSLLHRITTIDSLLKQSPRIFLSEYGFDSHIDPYDSTSYRGNLYPEFGSLRGPDPIYPRVVDLMRTRKNFVSLRFLQPTERLVDFANATSPAEFLDRCESDARAILGKFQEDHPGRGDPGVSAAASSS